MTIRRASRDFQVRPPRGPNFDPASMSVKVSGSMTIKDVVSRLGRLESMRQAAALFEEAAQAYSNLGERLHTIWCLAQKIECVPAHQIATVTAQIDSAAQGN